MFEDEEARRRPASAEPPAIGAPLHALSVEELDEHLAVAQATRAALRALGVPRIGCSRPSSTAHA